MRRMLELLKEQGFQKASLAVQKANYAVRMYEAVGFRTIDENAEEYMIQQSKVILWIVPRFALPQSSPIFAIRGAPAPLLAHIVGSH